MIAQSGTYGRGDRGRVLCALLASALINAFAWVVLPAFVVRYPRPEQAAERVVVATSFIRMERRRVQPRRVQPRRVQPRRVQPRRVQPRRIIAANPERAAQPRETPHVRSSPAAARSPSAGDAAMLAPPPPASLALPSGWTRQDFAFLNTTSTAEWLDWSKSHQNAKWVPRVFVWQMRAKPAYMRQPNLQDAVQQILGALRSDARLHTSKPQRVCDGQRDGWFFAYVKPDDDPPLHFDETVFIDGTKIYRAIYIRAVDQPEDAKTREALNTLCPA